MAAALCRRRVGTRELLPCRPPAFPSFSVTAAEGLLCTFMAGRFLRRWPPPSPTPGPSHMKKVSGVCVSSLLAQSPGHGVHGPEGPGRRVPCWTTGLRGFSSPGVMGGGSFSHHCPPSPIFQRCDCPCGQGSLWAVRFHGFEIHPCLSYKLALLRPFYMPSPFLSSPPAVSHLNFTTNLSYHT